jgi:hypothetical protein
MASRINSKTLPAILLCLLGCGGRGSPNVSDGGIVRDSTFDHAASRPDAGGHDAAKEASFPDADASTDAVTDVYYGPPSSDASKFDGCTPTSCETGQLCIDKLSFAQEKLYSICDNVPRGCGSDPTCLCIVEAANWCGSPNCTEDGGTTLTCSESPPP